MYTYETHLEKIGILIFFQQRLKLYTGIIKTIDVALPGGFPQIYLIRKKALMTKWLGRQNIHYII